MGIGYDFMEIDYDFLSSDELYRIKRNIEETIEKIEEDDDNMFDRGDPLYQEALMDLEEIEKEIEKRESSKNNENKMENILTFEQFSLNEKRRPSEGLTKKEKSDVVKRAKSGKDIGRRGKNFDKVVDKAKKQYGSEEIAKKVAASSMWKNLAKK